ncbi:2-oxo-4-hydroxy-4-carboxy-5-ureidoimidazoline decarboxylase [Nocardia sp. NBC_01327]|uniref:2-oxo-4-hydroxy-4-carboxy-5-ureidoimidazoline decarboxylase n=1 Tax=Nocardia sp. NBC_01327 TaxID=2903593 RepID=UPI002E15AB72|nr:2-oxo-4-hydroxy-4-carboxy-5-ureidoimidazoline decarboxylase [Nocardia sp. NBC_01327]
MSGRLEWLGSLPLEEAEAQLLTCCASQRWARKMVAGRPYVNESSLMQAAISGLGELAWPDVEEALEAHPRIGERAEAARAEGVSAEAAQREAQWSQDEQSGAATAADTVREALAAGNVAYEQRFGHVFLIRATGRSAEEMLSELTRRLANSPAEERTVVRAELVAITRLRIRKLLGLI